MAMQPVDRMKAKHAHKVASRKAPAMVNRAGKQVMVEMMPTHQRMLPRHINQYYNYEFRI